ncbi:MAG: alpha/beta fold hydrolase [Chloroflexales bacterium]
MPLIDTAAGPIFYAQRGRAGPALLCLHGAGGSHRHWLHLLDGLGDLARAYAADLPGHGGSASPGRASIAAYAESVFALMDALGLERAALAGHSMGAAAAIVAALDRPERVAGLALVGASARLRVLPALIPGLADDPAATIDMLVSMLYAAEAPAELRAAGVDDLRRCDPAVLRDDFRACDGFDIRPRLAELRTPALVVCGAEDRMTPPRLGAELHAGIVGAQLVTIAGTGHMIMLERPDQLIAALRGWLAC